MSNEVKYGIYHADSWGCNWLSSVSGRKTGWDEGFDAMLFSSEAEAIEFIAEHGDALDKDEVSVRRFKGDDDEGLVMADDSLFRQEEMMAEFHG